MSEQRAVASTEIGLEDGRPFIEVSFLSYEAGVEFPAYFVPLTVGECFAMARNLFTTGIRATLVIAEDQLRDVAKRLNEA